MKDEKWVPKIEISGKDIAQLIYDWADTTLFTLMISIVYLYLN